jgi:SsrA-binding protein
MNNKIISLSSNKKAFFDYEVLETWEAGIKLLGYEVKALREWKVNLRGSYIGHTNGELFLKWCHISPLWSLANKNSLDTKYPRKVFLEKKTIEYLIGKTLEPGKTLLVLEIYLSGSLIKVKVGLGVGRKSYDKKQVLKERSMDKEAKRKIKDISY